MPLYSARALPLRVRRSLLRHHSFLSPVKFSYYSSSKAASGSNSVRIGKASYNNGLYTRNREDLHSAGTGEGPSSNWGGTDTPWRRSTASSGASASADSSSKRHATRETIRFRCSVHCGLAAVTSASLVGAPRETAAAASAAASLAAMTRCSERFLRPGGMLLQSRAAAARAAVATSYFWRSEAGESERLTEVDILNHRGITESTFAGIRAVEAGLKQVRSTRATATAATVTTTAPTASKATATEQQCSSRRFGVDAKVPSSVQKNQLWRIDGKPITAAQPEAASKGVQVSGAWTAVLLGWDTASRIVQARSITRCCRAKQRRMEAVAPCLAALESKRKAAGVGRSRSVSGKHYVDTVPLSCVLATATTTAAATVVDAGFVRTRCTYTARRGGECGQGVCGAFFMKCFTTSGNRNKSPNSSECCDSSRVPYVHTNSMSSTQKSDYPGAAAASANEEEIKQKRTCDATQADFTFHAPPQNQRLLALLAALGACISLALLYERSLLDSATLLYGAWDPEWDAAWRLSAEQYEDELAAKGVQLFPPALGAAASGTAGEGPAASLRPPTRQIILVRHGQYILATADDERGLTDLGKRQAVATGRRLQEFLQGQHVQAIIHSDMRRARETAEIIQESGGFKMVPLVQDALLAEGAPAEPVPPSDSFWPSPTDIAVDGPRIEQAFRRYFYRPRWRSTPVASPIAKGLETVFSTSHTDATASAKASAAGAFDPSIDVQTSRRVTSTDSYVIIVCHGNVIRYFLMRALQLPACAWLRWALLNTGLTWISIDAKGRVSCRSFGDVGHLSPRMISYN